MRSKPCQILPNLAKPCQIIPSLSLVVSNQLRNIHDTYTIHIRYIHVTYTIYNRNIKLPTLKEYRQHPDCQSAFSLSIASVQRSRSLEFNSDTAPRSRLFTSSISPEFYSGTKRMSITPDFIRHFLCHVRRASARRCFFFFRRLPIGKKITLSLAYLLFLLYFCRRDTNRLFPPCTEALMLPAVKKMADTIWLSKQK